MISQTDLTCASATLLTGMIEAELYQRPRATIRHSFLSEIIARGGRRKAFHLHDHRRHICHAFREMAFKLSGLLLGFAYVARAPEESQGPREKTKYWHETLSKKEIKATEPEDVLQGVDSMEK